MEDEKLRFDTDKRDQEIVYSKAIKAGKRIYYLDVKRNRKDELFLAITESKKKVSGEEAQVSFEKHKIFLYREDFEKFMTGLNDVMDYIGKSSEQGEDRSNPVPSRFEIDFG
ncbi:MAG: PUR family DNA/RNA-binding protein [Paludibacteraceae bacterium]|nr:PUR family DNA/RNA-binding protein [Paludibacteraceae bacterium]MBR4713497.1 PUR family DNA/RNA-binding protein [Paludibacteraceae bacterium]MBR5374820.1 PUR family DNA/RNA-binding protein [Paludibacteraceae bacterium]